MEERRWFGGKARSIKSTRIQEVIPIVNGSSTAYITLVQVEYTDEDGEVYVLPMTYGAGELADTIIHDYPHAVCARLRITGTGQEGVIYDATVDRHFCDALLELIVRRRRPKGVEGELIAKPTRAFHRIQGTADVVLEPSILKAEQSNTSVLYGDRFILKLFRRLHAGVNPDLEIGRFLTEKGFGNIPPVAGAIEYQRGGEDPMTLAILQALVPNQGDAWEYTLDVLGHFFEQILAQPTEVPNAGLTSQPLLELVATEPPEEVFEKIGHYAEAARLLGQRTAELHVMLASAPDDPVFAPEPFSKLYQRALYQSMRSLAGNVFHLMRQRLGNLPDPVRPKAQNILNHEGDIINRFRSVMEQRITAMRIRCHGDYHLGQVLCTGKDFIIIDFEGEPARPISERRIKRSPLRDVAGMLRSFHYAAYARLFAQQKAGLIRSEDFSYLESWVEFWHSWVSVLFLKAYLEVAAQGGFLPRTREELQVLIDIYLLEKAIYEVGYELNNRPEWIRIPLQGILRQLRSAG